MHSIIVTLIANGFFFLIAAMEPDSLVTQCARKVAHCAYFGVGYTFKSLQKKLPWELNEKVAAQSVPLTRCMHLRDIGHRIYRGLVHSIVNCNYDRLALGSNGQVLIIVSDDNCKFKKLALLETTKYCYCTFCNNHVQPLEYCGNNRLAVVDSDRIKLYDIKHQTIKRRFAHSRLQSTFMALAYCGQNRLAVSKTYEGLAIWNVKSANRIMRLKNYNETTALVYFDNRLVSKDEEKIKVWDVDTGKESLSFATNLYADNRNALAFMGNNKFAAVELSAAMNKIIVRDVVTGDDSPVTYYTQNASMFHKGAITNLNDDYFAFSQADRITIFDKQSGKIMLRFKHTGRINDLVFYKNRYLLAATYDDIIMLDLECMIHPTLKDIIALREGQTWYKKILKKILF